VPDLGLSFVEIVVVLAVSVIGGVIRGFSGFGSALAMAPVLSLLVGPREAVPAATLLFMVTTAQLAPGATRKAAWDKLWPLGLASCVGVPMGVYVLLVVDPELMRRAIAVGVAVFSAILLAGWRYERTPGRALTLSVGGIGGALTGAASIGGPPVIAFLLAGPDSAATNRATLIFYFLFSQVIAVALYVAGGIITARVLWLAVLMLPAQMAGLWIGAKLFPKASEASYRRIALGFLLLIGIVTTVL
jgi:hypothetical protein